MRKRLGFVLIALCVLGVATKGFAKDCYTIVPLPDTIVQKTPLDTAIYNNTAEFFTPYIVNELNKTQFIKAPTVNDVRTKITSDYWLTKSVTKSMDEFRRFYKLDFDFTKKISALYDTNYVLLITSTTDYTNYITRRTWWDFFNIAGASVLDPAYKINIYAVLIDTEKDMIVWNKTYQKTLSVVENRIVATGYTPQTEQLQKIKDYSVYLAPRMAQSIQDTLLTEAQKIVEPNLIHTDYGSIDNVFTKKYRGLRKEIKDATVIPAAKTREGYGAAKEKYNELKEDYQKNRAKKQQEKLEKENSNNIQPVNNVVPAVVTEPVKQEVKNITPEKKVEEQIIKKDVTPIKQEVKKEVVEVKKTEPTPIVTKKEIEQKEQVLQKEKSEPKPELKAEPKSEIVLPKKEIKQVKEIKETAPVEKTNVVLPPMEEKPFIQPKQEIENKIKIPEDIDTRSKNLLDRVFNRSSVENKDMPVDSLIYTHPTNYRTNDYIPVKPRLREIKTDDTYNAF